LHHWTGRFPCLLKRSVMMQQKRTRSQLDDLIGSNVVANSFWATLLHVLRSSKHAACGEQMPKSQWTLPNMCWAVFDHVKFRAMTSSRSTSKTPVIIFEPFSARYIYVSICCNEGEVQVGICREAVCMSGVLDLLLTWVATEAAQRFRSAKRGGGP